MPAITEKGRLPIGLEYGGTLHVEYELRALKVKDIIATAQPFESPSAVYADCVGFGLRLVKLGGVPLEDIRQQANGIVKLADLLTELHEEDLNELYGAKERLKKKLSAPSETSPAPTRSSP